MDTPILRRIERDFEGASGQCLHRRAWVPARPERVVALVHGFAEHAGRYDTFGAWFASRGSVVHAYDQRGHGRSEGRRRHVDRFDDYLDDLDLFLECLASEHPGLPLFLIGHSMGGLVVATHACERSPAVAAVVTSGAALAVSDAGRARLRALRLLARVAPRMSIDVGIDPEGLSRDPEVVRRYVEDPLVETRMTLSHAAAMLDAIQRTAAAPERVRVPMLLLHGAEDPMCPASGSEAFHAGLEAPARALKVYPRLRHEIFNEPERETVFQDVLEWMREREAEGTP